MAKNLSVRVEDDRQLKRWERAAKADNRPLSQWVRKALDAAARSTANPSGSALVIPEEMMKKGRKLAGYFKEGK